MFTGIVEEVGKVRTAAPRGDGLAIEVAAGTVTDDLAPGDSIAVNGVCLTVTDVGPGAFTADVVGETRRRTYLDRLRPGDPVNLERALAAGDRFGGHFVQGHVDGVGEVVSIRAERTGKTLVVRAPAGLDRYCIEKGSIALDGVSLTIAALEGNGVRVALVPMTLEKTILGGKRGGSPVHVEVDMIGKYVEKMARPEGRLAEWLRE